jgi:hypothetical protein
MPAATPQARRTIVGMLIIGLLWHACTSYTAFSQHMFFSVVEAKVLASRIW